MLKTISKKLLVLLLLFPITSCSTLWHVPGKEIKWDVDFRKYAAQGFLFTPEVYLGEYTTLGILVYELRPPANYEKIGMNKGFWKQEPYALDKAVEYAYNYSVGMGGDAFVRFEFEETEYYSERYNEETERYYSNTAKLFGIRIRGYVIKRE